MFYSYRGHSLTCVCRLIRSVFETMFYSVPFFTRVFGLFPTLGQNIMNIIIIIIIIISVAIINNFIWVARTLVKSIGKP